MTTTISSISSSSLTTSNNNNISNNNESDSGWYLHEKLIEELIIDEFNLKCRISQLDEHTKRRLNYDSIPKYISNEIYETSQRSIPWNSSKFSNTTIMHLTCLPNDMDARIVSITHTSLALGGNKLPNKTILDRISRSNILTEVVQYAKTKLENENISTVLAVSLFDVELNENSSNSSVSRATTFSHHFTMTISQCGAYIYQAYGPIGYTLKQYLLNHPSPLNWEQLDQFLDNLNQFMRKSVEDKGYWTLESNNLFNTLFDVNLISLGVMRVGSQFHPYLQVQSHPFTTQMVQQNFNILPKLTFPTVPCIDQEIASGARECNYFRVDGGTPRKYTPQFTSTEYTTQGNICNYCEYQDTNGLLKCSRCLNVSYCCKQHQKIDWKKHKHHCQPSQQT